MGPNQTYKLLHNRGNHKQNEKITYGMGENICIPYKASFPKYTHSAYNSITKKQTTQSKNGQKT